MGASGQDSIRDRYRQVLERVDKAARSVGRDAGEVRVVVVTKAQPVELVQAAVEAGARYLGENYVEEAIPKIQSLKEHPEVEWHMIGHIQSRKARSVCENFSYVHSLDRIKVARRLNRFARDLGRRLPALLEYNVSGEETKFGWPAWDQADWPTLLPGIAELLDLPNLEVRGLMTMPPMGRTPEEARPYFQQLRELREYLQSQFPQACWRELSMGMSSDFEVAVQEGATFIRVGQAILGPRPTEG